MNIKCILCEQLFKPSSKQLQKILHHPQKLQICPNCYKKISQQILARKKL